MLKDFALCYENNDLIDFEGIITRAFEGFTQEESATLEELKNNFRTLYNNRQGTDELFAYFVERRYANKNMGQIGVSYNALDLYLQDKLTTLLTRINFYKKFTYLDALADMQLNSRGEEVTEYTPQVKRRLKNITVAKAGYDTATSGVQNQSAGQQTESESGDIEITGTDTTTRKLSGGQTLGELHEEINGLTDKTLFNEVLSILESLYISVDRLDDYPYSELEQYEIVILAD